MILRPMEEKDVPRVAAIEASLFTDPWSETGYRDTLKRPEAYFLTAEEDGQVLGFAGFYQALDEAEIVNVAVDKNCQNKGVGLKLVHRLMEDGLAKGVNMFILEVRLSNMPAQHVYEKAGFENIGIRKNFYNNPKEHAVIMRWLRPGFEL